MIQIVSCQISIIRLLAVIPILSLKMKWIFVLLLPFVLLGIKIQNLKNCICDRLSPLIKIVVGVRLNTGTASTARRTRGRQTPAATSVTLTSCPATRTVSPCPSPRERNEKIIHIYN